MLASLKEVLAEGNARKIAIGSFNTPNLECMLAVIKAAEEVNVPVIMMHAECHESVAPIDKIGRVMIEMAKCAKVKVCVHLDHGEDYSYCKKAIDMGFTSVMIDNSTLPYEENISNTKKVVEYAHAHGVDVEAELGRLPNREGGGVKESADNLYTNPNLVPDFVKRTEVDVLAIAFGTAHGIYKVKPVLNTEIIAAVKKVTNVPLVMHGGSGISEEEYREVISKGISKINYYTYMSYEGYAAAKKLTEEKSTGFYHDLALAAQNAMYENVLKTIRIFAGV